MLKGQELLDAIHQYEGCKKPALERLNRAERLLQQAKEVLQEAVFYPHEPLIMQWAQEKGIMDSGTPEAQAMKTLEEWQEMMEAILDDDLDEIRDAIGDQMVTLIIQAHMHGLDLYECVDQAWNTIKGRKGRMVNGQFVKE